MEWLTYELKKKIIVVMCIMSAISCAVGVIGMYFTAELVADSSSSSSTPTIDPGPFMWPMVVGVALFFSMLTWYHTISRRRPAIKAGTYKPLNG